MKWNEQMIRNELEKLDKATGLEGSKLPIYFAEKNGKNWIACYYYEKFFVFYESFSCEGEFPIEDQLNTIRHEYAYPNKKQIQ